MTSPLVLNIPSPEADPSVGYTVINSASIANNTFLKFTWPGTDGSAGQFLKTSDGAGTLTWGSILLDPETQQKFADLDKRIADLELQLKNATIVMNS